jgi:DNA-binding NarL/FixJ family response regulator
MLTNSPLKIVLCHPFEIFRDGIAQLFQNELNCHIVGRHANPVDAFMHAIDSAADLVFIDLTYLDLKACVETLARARRIGMSARVALIAGAKQLRQLKNTVPDEFDAWLLNTCSADALLSMIRERGHGMPQTHGSGETASLCRGIGGVRAPRRHLTYSQAEISVRS